VNPLKEHNNWSEFATEISKLIFFWFFGTVFFQLHRLILILIFKNQIDVSSGWPEFYKTISMGFRFDSTVIAYFILIPFITCLILSPFGKIDFAIRARKFFQLLFIIIAPIVSVVSINYFREYNDQFNQFLFVGLYDDKKAIIETVYNHFHPFLNLFLVIFAITISVFIFKYFEKINLVSGYIQRIKRIPYRILFILIIIILFVGSIRGSFGSRPAMRKWSDVTMDQFLNKTIINPFRSLQYAIGDFKKINKIGGSNPFGEVTEYFTSPEYNTVSDIITKTSEGPIIKKPKHIFVIIMESLDMWPLIDKYASFNVAPNVKYFSEHGFNFPNFLPSSNSTMNSFGSIVTGIPYTGVNISKIGAIGEPYPSSIFTQFEDLGYVTNFFYGGFLSWQNIGNLVSNQGADNLFSAADAGGKTESGVWGIDDDMLFDLVINSIDGNRNSLNIILTTSYHPPYTIDVYEKGFMYKSKDDLPSEAQTNYDGAMSILALGHLWYSDKAIGDFVEEVEKEYPNSIFCFTGDHYGRRFINSNPNLRETSEVPFIIYGNDIEPKTYDSPGSHFDILPTLIEMVAPKGFKYFAFGNSLSNNQKDKIGIGYQKVISKSEIQYFSTSSDIQSFDLDTNNLSYIKKSRYISDYNKLLSLAWHYTVRGNILNAEK